MFVVDDLVAWLVGLVADTGRERLTTWVLGSDQERALARAAKAAVDRTVKELRPEGGVRAEELAMVIGEVFGAPTPEALIAHHATMLEALQAEIFRQLAPLDDASLTVGGKSSAELLGFPASTLAGKLSTYLVREIVIRGAEGDPLAPLAAHLRDEAIYLQGRRIEVLVSELATDVRDALARPGSPEPVAGTSPPMPPRRRDPLRCTAPPVPASHISRPDILARAKSALLNPADEEAPIVGLVGVAGVGKSRMAREIARDPEVLRRFPDGAVWVNVGQNPDIPSRQAWVAEAYGEFFPFADSSSGSQGLRRLLAEARCLLILDDVWDRADLAAFDALPGGSAILLTTRDRGALFVTSTSIPVGPFERPASLHLIASLTGVAFSELPGEAIEIARLCGDLPLAVAIASGSVVSGSGWRAVVERLARGSLLAADSALRDYPFPNLWKAIDASISSLPSETAGLYRTLLVFQGCGPVPGKVVGTLWFRARGGKPAEGESDADEALAVLSRRSLLQRDESGTVTLHDLLFQYLHAQVTADSLAALHGTVADLLVAPWGGLRENLPALEFSDISSPVAQYTLRNLCRHLATARRVDHVHALLGEDITSSGVHSGNRWYAAHEKVGGVAAYLADLRMAWSLAETATDRALAEGIQVTSLGLEARYSLMFASLATIGGNVPVPLLRALAARGVWTPERTLSFADAIVDPGARDDAYIALARYMAEPQRHQAFGDALRRTKGNRDLLREVAGELPADLIEEALQVIAEDPRPFQSEVIAALADVAPRAALGTTARMICEHPETGGNSGVFDLVALAPHLDEQQLAAVIEATRQTMSLDVAAELRCRLMPHLPPRLRAEACREVVEDLTVLAEYRRVGLATESSAPYLEADQVTRLLERTDTLAEQDSAAELLAPLLPRVPERARQEVSRRALEVARATANDNVRARALGWISLTMHGEDRARIAAEARDAAEGGAYTDWGSTQVSILLDIAKTLPEALREPLINEAWEVLKASTYAPTAVWDFRLLRPHLDPRRTVAGASLVIGLAEAWSGSQPGSLDLLVSMAEFLSEETIERLLNETGRVDDHRARAKLVAAVAPYLPARLLPKAVEFVRAINDTRARDRGLVSMLPQLGPFRLDDALALARRETDAFTRAALLADVASAAPSPFQPDLRREALTAYLDSVGHRYPGNFLHRLARLLTATGVELVLSSLSVLDSDRGLWDVRPLALLAQHLPRGHLAGLLDEIRAIGRGDSPITAEGSETSWDSAFLGTAAGWQHDALLEIAAYLPPELLLDSLEVANGIADPSRAHSAFAHLVSRLPPRVSQPMLGEALRRAREIEPDAIRAVALAATLSAVPEAQRRTVFNEAIAAAAQTVSFFDDEREQTLARMIEFLPTDLALEVIAAGIEPFSDFGVRVFADLVSRLPDALVHDAFKSFIDKRGYSSFLWPDLELVFLALARRLPAEDVLAVLRSVDTHGFLDWGELLAVDAYARLATADRARWLGQARAATRAIREPKVVELLVDSLPPDLLGDAIEAIRHAGSVEIVRHAKCPEVLAEISVLVEPGAGSSLRQEALRMAAEIEKPPERLACVLFILARCAGGERLEALRLALLAAASTERPEVLAACGRLTESACRLDTTAAAAIDAAIEDVCRWWP